MAEGTTAWIRLGFVIDGSLLVASYADSLSRSAIPTGKSSFSPGWEHQPLLDGAPLLQRADVSGLWWPIVATRHVFDLLASTPTWRDPTHADGPVIISVLVAPPAGRRGDVVYELIAARLLESLGVGRQKFSVATEVDPGVETRRFTLPLDVGYAAPAAARFRQFVKHLLGRLNARQLEHAIRVTQVAPGELRRRADRFDLVITDSTECLALLSGKRLRRGPHLLVVENFTRIEPDVDVDRLPYGTSLVGLPTRDPAGSQKVVQEIVRGFTHDLPLHESLANAARDLGLSPEQRARVRVFTSAPGLDALRLSGPYEQVEERRQELVKYTGFRHVKVPRPLRLDRLSRAVDMADLVSRDFRRESAALSEMAMANEAYVEAGPDLERLEQAAFELGSDKRLGELSRSASRRVAIWVTRPTVEWDSGRPLDLGKRTILARSRRYTVNVGVGISRPTTDLVPDDTPALDPILPPSPQRARKLDVAVFSDTVEVVGPRRKALKLTPVGPCGPVTFEIETPARSGRASLRVLIYYRRHIVQAFSVDIQVGPRERYSDRDVLRAPVVFSRRTQLQEVEHLPARALAVATNSNHDGASHLLMFDSGYAVKLSEKLIGDFQQFYRAELAAAYKAARGQEHLADEPLRALVLALATKGADLWDKLVLNLPHAATKPLKVLRAANDTSAPVVQMLRIQPEFAFPWAMLYDWSLPETPDTLRATPICLGVRNDKTCDCTATSTAAICVRGFWGIRLVIEELVRSPEADEYVDEVTGAAGSPIVVSTIGVDNDKWTASMVDGMTTTLGESRFEDLGQDLSLLQRMSDPAVRPAVLVVIGHLTDKQVDDEANAPRIYVRAQERYLVTRALAKLKLDHGRWEPPQRPIVLLLACNSGEDELGKVPSFLGGLSSLSAAAVIATEEKIDTRLASAVAMAVVPQLGTVGPGESLRRWRAAEFGRGNPFGLLFTCFGSAGVTVAEFETTKEPVAAGATGGSD